MNLVNIGFGNLISIVSPESAPVKRIVQKGKENGTLIDATQGRKTKSVIITDSDNVVLSYMDLKQISQRFGGEVISDE